MVSEYTSVFYTDMFSCRGLRCGCGFLSGGKYSKTGVYHFSSEGVCSWYDFSKMIASFAGQTGCKIEPCYSCDFPSPVKRPAYSVLDKSKIKAVFGVEVPYWTDSLKKCISNLKAEK